MTQNKFDLELDHTSALKLSLDLGTNEIQEWWDYYYNWLLYRSLLDVGQEKEDELKLECMQRLEAWCWARSLDDHLKKVKKAIAWSEQPILFSGPMVKAILLGTKTCTRRIFNGETRYNKQYLWVKETFRHFAGCTMYKADWNGVEKIKWTPSLFMSKRYSRIYLKRILTEIQYLHSITDEEAINEGFDSRQSFLDYFYKLNPKVTGDPMVEVIHFKLITQ